jgi:hypothetical protein
VSTVIGFLVGWTLVAWLLLLAVLNSSRERERELSRRAGRSKADRKADRQQRERMSRGVEE